MHMPHKLHFSISTVISPILPGLKRARTSFFGKVNSTLIASSGHESLQISYKFVTDELAEYE